MAAKESSPLKFQMSGRRVNKRLSEEALFKPFKELGKEIQVKGPANAKALRW